MTENAVLISVQPKWLKLIINGQKTIEVRKTAPARVTVPFKCYLYCTMPNTTDPSQSLHLWVWDKETPPRLNGKVVGEFMCDKLFPIWPGYAGKDGDSCLTYTEMEDYLGEQESGWAFHIPEVITYDEPRELGSLYTVKGGPVTRAPQSWMYVKDEPTQQEQEVQEKQNEITEFCDYYTSYVREHARDPEKWLENGTIRGEIPLHGYDCRTQIDPAPDPAELICGYALSKELAATFLDGWDDGDVFLKASLMHPRALAGLFMFAGWPEWSDKRETTILPMYVNKYELLSALIRPIRFVAEKHKDSGNTAVVYYPWSGSKPEPITVELNTNGCIGENEAFIDVYKYPWAPLFFVLHKAAENTGKIAIVGHCGYPLYRFKPETFNDLPDPKCEVNDDDIFGPLGYWMSKKPIGWSRYAYGGSTAIIGALNEYGQPTVYSEYVSGLSCDEVVIPHALAGELNAAFTGKTVKLSDGNKAHVYTIDKNSIPRVITYLAGIDDKTQKI